MCVFKLWFSDSNCKECTDYYNLNYNLKHFKNTIIWQSNKKRNAADWF